ncbi:MAG: RNA methyltransferase [Clostridia bacterium]|nr:RNA methyltransferase [Clostridia bacterium]
MADYIIEGSVSVKAVLNGGKREISEILFDRDRKDRDLSYILKKAKEKGVKYTPCKRSDIDAVASGKTHGGLIAYVGDRRYETEKELFGAEKPFIVLLEGIEDPYNFGDSLRSVMAAGATGVIVPSRNWLTAASVVIKASAGASEYLPTLVSEDLGKTVLAARERGIKVFCAERRDAVSLYEKDLTEPVILAIGGEMRGLSRAVLDNADGNVFIPYGSDFRCALSASAASAVIGFEVMRQRMK